MIALIDCNNFYASCEQVFQPQLAGKPLVVLSNNDGNVIARSAEAKKMGIGMGVLTGSVRKFVRNHGLQIRSSNYALYGDMSSRVMETLEALLPNVERYSIDEAFADLSGLSRARMLELCQHVRHRVQRHTGLQVSIGVAQTKTLAKVANRLAKRRPELSGRPHRCCSVPRWVKALPVFPSPDCSYRRKEHSSMSVSAVRGSGQIHGHCRSAPPFRCPSSLLRRSGQ